MGLGQTVFDMFGGIEYTFAATLTKKTAGTYDPETQTISGQVTTTHDCYVLFDKMKAFPPHVEIKIGDRFAVVATNGVIIEPGNTITIGSDVYSVLPGTCENSAGQNALFDVLMR